MSETKAKRSPGRPLKLTDAVRDKIVTALKGGNYRQIAALHAGISVSTFYRWLEQGEADVEHDKDSPFRELWEAVTRAEAEAEHFAVGCMRQAMREDWRAAQAYLERRHAGRWGRAVQVEHSGTIREVVVEVAPDDERRFQVANMLDGQGALNGHGSGH